MKLECHVTVKQIVATNSKVSLDDFFNQIQQGEVKEINIIIKADVQGSVEAMRGSLEKIEVEGVKLTSFIQVLVRLLNMILCWLLHQMQLSLVLMFVLM